MHGMYQSAVKFQETTHPLSVGQETEVMKLASDTVQLLTAKQNHFLEPLPILHGCGYIMSNSLQSRWPFDALEANCCLFIFPVLHHNSCGSGQQEQEETHSPFSLHLFL